MLTRILTRRMTIAAAFALPFVAIGTNSALANDLQFTLNNATSYTLMEFYASPTDVESWEEDILGSDVLPSGESVRVTIGDGRTQCEYDIKGVFEDGESVEHMGVDLCEMNGGLYQFTE